MSTSTDVATMTNENGERNVTAHRCNPERTVFTERENSDGWIATDLTVELER